MKCEKCGKLLDDGATFCPECGARVESSAAANNFNADADAQARFVSYMEQNQPTAQVFGEENQPKKKKGPVIAAIAAVLVVALGIGGVFAYPSILRTVAPKSYMNYAQKQTEKVMNKDTEALKNAWGGAVLDEIKSGVWAQKATVDFKDLVTGVPEADEIMKNIALTMNSVSDKANKKMSADFEVSALGASVKAEGYMTEDDLILKIPGMLDAIKISDKDFAAKWNASDFAEYFSEMDSEMKFDFADLFKDDKSSMWSPESELVKKYTEKMKALQDGATVEKGPKAAVSGAGTQEYYQFIYKYDSAEYNALVKEFTKDFFNEYFEQMDAMFFGVLEDDMKAEAMEELTSGIDEMAYDNIVTTVYVNDANCIVGEKISFDITADGETVNVTVDMLMRGESSLLDDIYMNITATNEDEKINMLLESKGNHAMKDGKFTDETKLTINADDEINTATVSVEWDSNAANDNLKLALDIPSVDIKFEIIGNYTVDKANKKIAVKLSNVKLNAPDGVSGDWKFNIAYELSAATAADVKAITDDAIDLFDNQAMAKIQELMMNLASQFGGVDIDDGKFDDDFIGDDYNDDDFYGDDYNEDYGDDFAEEDLENLEDLEDYLNGIQFDEEDFAA